MSKPRNRQLDDDRDAVPAARYSTIASDAEKNSEATLKPGASEVEGALTVVTEIVRVRRSTNVLEDVRHVACAVQHGDDG